MHHSLTFWLAAIFGLLAAASIFYNVLSLLGGRSFSRMRYAVPAEWPGVTILKPLKGTDPEMYEAFRSHCLQTYAGAVQIVFGISEADDPAARFIERLRDEFPGHDIKLVYCRQRLGANRKVSNLVQMSREIKYPLVVVNDSDMKVPAEYLESVVSAFTSAKTGMVTCLYRGLAERGLWSRLEAFGVSTEFMPACLTARLVEGGVHYGLGATLAVRREVLEKIGGFGVLADYLADDYELSRAVIAAGFDVALAQVIVETHMPEYDWHSFAAHQLRWLRAVRASRPAQYFGLAVLFGGLWSALTIALSRGAGWAWALLAAFFAVRVLVVEMVSVRVMGDATARRNLWMLPLREVLTPALWAVGGFGNSIEWRGEKFNLRGGKLEKP